MEVMPEQKRRGRKRASGHTRRQIIKLTGATAALSGITASTQTASGFATGDQDDDSGTTSEVAGGDADNEGTLQWNGGDADNNEEPTQTGILDVIDRFLQNNTHIAQWLNPLISALIILVTYFLNRTNRDKN
jgi:hypothetical protein